MLHFRFPAPNPYPLKEGAGASPRHPVVHRSANDTTPPLEGRGIKLLEITVIRTITLDLTLIGWYNIFKANVPLGKGEAL